MAGPRCKTCGAGLNALGSFDCRCGLAPTSLAIHRVEKATDNTKNDLIATVELLLRDLKSGNCKANKMLVLLMQVETAPPSVEVESYRAGVTRLDESGMLAAFSARHHRRWFGGE